MCRVEINEKLIRKKYYRKLVPDTNFNEDPFSDFANQIEH